MMSANTVDEAGPGLAPALFLGLLSLLLGAVLGVASMVSQPVTILTKQADLETLAPGTVYFIRGDRLGRSAWEAKEEAWSARTVGVLTLTEQDLNQWSRERLKAPVDLEPGESSGFLDFLELTVEPANFRILDDRLQISTEIKLEGIFPDRTFVYQVHGHFQAVDGGVVFVPDTGSLGSAPLGSVPALKDLLFSLMSRQFESTSGGSWVPDALAGMETVELGDGQLVLRRRADS